MENSDSAEQYPQESAERTKRTLHGRAHAPPRRQRCLIRETARELGVGRRRSPPGRLAMMAGSPQAGGARRVRAEKKNTKTRGNYFYNFAAASGPSALPLREKSPPCPAARTGAAPPNPSGEESRSMREEEMFFQKLFRLRVAPTPGSVSVRA